ncbi:MAG: DUF2752 domain-containing protein [Clostridia bacterium]|nr:DUF2752 domain-containing protein [Clostridia bacterium]
MDSHWYKTEKQNNRKRHTLHSLSVGFVFFVILFILTKIFSISLCPIKAIFGISCFGCGMTRGFISILYLDFKAAFEYNVLSIPLFVGIALFSIFSLLDFFFDKNFIYIIEKQLAKKYMYLIYFLILVIATVFNNIY